MIIIETIPHEDQRYPTVGDYFIDNNKDLIVRVSECKDWRYEVLVAVHELIEATLCFDRGITIQSIDAFDTAHLDSDNPGGLPDAPYHKEHEFAERLERLLAQEFGIDWDEYDRALKALDEKPSQEATDGPR